MHTTALLANDTKYLCYVGMETDLIFNQGVELPGFASFPLLETDAGRARLLSYAKAQIELGRRFGLGVILETPTWIANADRAAPLGYAPDQIGAITTQAADFFNAARQDAAEVPTLVSANIGPRSDAYAPAERMTVAQARDYHCVQVAAAAQAGADMVSGFTLSYANEAAGIARAAQDSGIAVVIAFTVETDGRLPGGETLGEAIAQVDDQSGHTPAYYMVNCAHPDHFDTVLDDPNVRDRLRGVVVNASRCSHAELDEAEVLDDGNPVELGQQLGAFAKRLAGLRVFGGCCGTDMRHMREIARNVAGHRA